MQALLCCTRYIRWCFSVLSIIWSCPPISARHTTYMSILEYHEISLCVTGYGAESRKAALNGKQLTIKSMFSSTPRSVTTLTPAVALAGPSNSAGATKGGPFWRT